MKNKVLAFLMISVMLMSLVSCNQGSSNESPEKIPETTKSASSESESVDEKSSDDGYMIGFSNFGLNDSWRVQMEAEFKNHADELVSQGIISNYVMLQANGDQSKQISDIGDLITMGCDAIIVTAITPDGLNSVLDEAREEGIKVINFNQSTNGEVDCRIVVSDYELGYTSGTWLGKLMPEGAKVVVLDGQEGNAINAARHEGGVDGLIETCPSVDIIATLNLNWDYATAKAAMEELLTAYPTIDGILSQGGAMTQAAIDAYIDAGRDFVPMTGEASNGFLRVWMENIDNGLETMAFTNPTYISAIALDKTIDILNGEDVDKEIIINEPPVTIDDAKKLYREDVNDSFWVHTYLPENDVKELFPK